MRNRRRRENKSLVADINVVPYIDVMLVLLVIFMVTAPLLQQGVAVDLPQASANPIEPSEKEPLVVSVDAQGAYFLNIADNPNKPIEPQALMVRVAAELDRDKNRKILVKGDRNVDYGQVMGAMVLLQKAGAPGVGLVTQDNDSDTAMAKSNKHSS
ncbi:MAG TPA: protein TolR [Gammaproteobacteria bacterium]|nr:protein TolR [Gammaproteobacteria bacterium]